MTDEFSKCHPAVNFLFFAGAIGSSVIIQHPLYLTVGIFTGIIYYLQLNGRKGLKTILSMAVLLIFLTLINPIFNTFGETPLCYLLGRPYTFEALRYGLVLGIEFVTLLLWFGCYNKVLTSDKFTSLFGNLIPAVSLILVMVFRMVPNLMRKAAQIIGARKSIGKGVQDNNTFKEKIIDGAKVLGTLTSWALEGSIVTSDSMKSRGYGSAVRSRFMIYRMAFKDWVLLILISALLILVIVSACFNHMKATYMPEFYVAPISWGIIPYTIYLLIPIVLHIKEAIQWRISRLKI